MAFYFKSFKNYFFNKSLISPSKTSSVVGAGGGAGAASSFFFIEFIAFTTMNIANAIIREINCCINKHAVIQCNGAMPSEPGHLSSMPT